MHACDVGGCVRVPLLRTPCGRYGLEWKVSGNLVFYLDGVVTSEIAASEWNPTGVVDEAGSVSLASLFGPIPNLLATTPTDNTYRHLHV
jgi:hypothetical protein